MPTEPPDDWSSRRLGELVTRHFSGPSPTCEERNIQSESEWGLLKTTAITWSGWDETAHKVPPPQYNNPSIEVCAGDVLVTKAGPRHRVGVVVNVPSTRPRLMVSGKMVGLRPDFGQVVPRVLAGLLATPAPQKFLDHRTTGMAESQVNFANSTLLDTPVCVPPLTEQRAIATVLDTIDEAIRKTEEIIAKLQQVKQGLLHDLLTRGIDDNGELRDPHGHPGQFKDSPLGRIPKAWDVVTTEEVCSHIVDCPHSTPEYVDTGIPCIRTADMVPGRLLLHQARRVTERTYQVRAQRLVPIDGDIIYSREGERLGIASPVGPERICLAQRVMHLRPGSRTDAHFLVWAMNAPSYYRQAAVNIGATTSPHVNLADIRRFRLAAPPLAEQQSIGEALRRHDARVRYEERELVKLREVQQGLTKDLLTGRVRVTPLAEEAAE
jgi:type I restriction enzyme S subunit